MAAEAGVTPDIAMQCTPYGQIMDVVSSSPLIGFLPKFLFSAQHPQIQALNFAGTSTLGREMVGWMQDYGILVDLSHSSADTARDVLDIATAPVLFSHSNAAALCDVSRNVPDDVLRRLPGNGGIVMVAFGSEFVSKPFSDWMARGDAYWAELMKQYNGDRARVGPLMEQWERDNPVPSTGSISDLADHIDHIRDVAGLDHVGIGADFDGIPATVKGLEDVSTYPQLFEELARRGWSDVAIKKLAGDNFLRVLDAADERARSARH